MAETKSKKKIIIIAAAITIVIAGIILAVCLILNGRDKNSSDIDMKLYDNAGAQIGGFLSDEEYTGLTLDEKRECAIERLQSIEGIDPDSVAAGEDEYVFFQYTDGAHGMITLEEPDEYSIGSGDVISVRTANGKSDIEICEINTPDFGNMQADEIYENGKPKVLMLDAFSENGPNEIFTKFANAWSNSNIDCTYDSDVTLDELATKMADYDMTVVLIHGGYSKEHADSIPTASDPHLIFTHEESSLDVTMKYWNHIISGSVILNTGSDGKTTYVVTGDFFEMHYGKSGVLKDKIIFFGSCKSHYMGDQLMKAMGAKAVIGPTETVSNIYFYSIINDFMYSLMKGGNVGESLDYSESLNGAHHAEYSEKLYKKIFGIAYSADNQYKDINTSMPESDYNDWVKFLDNYRAVNPEFRLCGDDDAVLVTLKKEAETYLEEHISSENDTEEETDAPKENEDKDSLLLSAVNENKTLYENAYAVWFQDLNLDGTSEFIIDFGSYTEGYYLNGEKLTKITQHGDLHENIPSMDYLRLYYNAETETYGYHQEAGVTMWCTVNDVTYSDGTLMCKNIASRNVDDGSGEIQSEWYNKEGEVISETEYAKIYNSYIENLTEYSYVIDKIYTKDFKKLSEDEKQLRLKKSCDAFEMGEIIGKFDEYLAGSSSEGSQTTTNSSKDKNTSSTTASNVKYYTMNDFSEGYAWVYFKDGNKCYYGCIDKTGKMIFKKDATNILEVTAFKNGCSHIKYKNAYAVIDKQGNELSRLTTNSNKTICAYGEGYTLIQEYSAGFDFSGYKYTIFDKNGTAVANWERQKEYYGRIKYMGEGVFSFYGEDQGYYCCKSNKWVDYEGNMQQTFNDEYVIIETGRSRVSLMDSLGNVKEITTSGDMAGDYSWYSTVGSGICVLYKYFNGDSLIAYDIKNNSFATMSNYYAQRTDWDQFLDDNCFNSFIGQRMLVPLTGDDGAEYVVLFDKNWNAVSDPVRADSYFYSDGRFIAYQSHYNASSLSIAVDDITVYDENCKRLFNMSDIGFSGYQIYGYSDGVARIIKSGTTKYIDKNGKQLFSEIDMSKAILK